MNKDPEEIRMDIEQTRVELRGDVDAIVDKVSPSSIAHRQNEKIKNSVRRAKDAVMGTTESASDHTHEALGEVGDTVREAPARVAAQTRGNPLAAGLIAFGAGLLASSLFPSSDTEQELVKNLKDKAEPVTSELADAAQHIAEDMKEPVAEATEAVKSSVQESAATLKDDTASEARHLKDQADDAAANLSEDVQRPDAGPWTTGDRI
ncbi:DUF3618 domain-containing protein [Paeniglutamicibacter kerguelensis]|uniref:Gas vesicle protein n=1 Tax=Paeniglutamicibacter kerguelensis TaxID=254788 RepID=A0ABS4XCR4_9MICC|nr:DUF3618 domain-containing protein [Paeniglutamicibacter kerguelensis]MBP2386250.1 gas vesicle protein [Paeniglutamicibacter kerguelensis]